VVVAAVAALPPVEELQGRLALAAVDAQQPVVLAGGVGHHGHVEDGSAGRDHEGRPLRVGHRAGLGHGRRERRRTVSGRHDALGPEVDGAAELQATAVQRDLLAAGRATAEDELGSEVDSHDLGDVVVGRFRDDVPDVVTAVGPDPLERRHRGVRAAGSLEVAQADRRLQEDVLLGGEARPRPR
jgi:hypothetical protein